MKITEAYAHMKEVIENAKRDNTDIKIVRAYLNRYVVDLANDKKITWIERRVLLEICQKLRKILNGELDIDDVFIEALATYNEEYQKKRKASIKKKTKKENNNGKISEETN